MNLHFERGDRAAPLGHALIYFSADDGAIVAMSVSVSPIKFDLSSYVPEVFAGAMKGLDLGKAMVVALPPVPEQVPGLEYLQELAARRQDDLVYAGAVSRSDPMRLMAEAAEAMQAYAELYGAVEEQPIAEPQPVPRSESSVYAGMDQREQLNELNQLTGRLLVSLSNGEADTEVKQQMQELANILPPKYRVRELIAALQQPGERSRKLAELYMERCYKLFNEDYLDLERIDREIEAAHG